MLEKITLPAARKNANLTQKDLATRCGVSESTVVNWEKGRSEPTISQAQKIGEVCGISYADIIFLPSVAVKPQLKEARNGSKRNFFRESL